MLSYCDTSSLGKAVLAVCVTVAAIHFESANILWWYLLMLVFNF